MGILKQRKLSIKQAAKSEHEKFSKQKPQVELKR